MAESSCRWQAPPGIDMPAQVSLHMHLANHLVRACLSMPAGISSCLMNGIALSWQTHQSYPDTTKSSVINECLLMLSGMHNSGILQHKSVYWNLNDIDGTFSSKQTQNEGGKVVLSKFTYQYQWLSWRAMPWMRLDDSVILTLQPHKKEQRS